MKSHPFDILDLYIFGLNRKGCLKFNPQNEDFDLPPAQEIKEICPFQELEEVDKNPAWYQISISVLKSLFSEMTLSHLEERILRLC